MLYLGDAYKNEQELKRIVQYYSFKGMPYQAAQILERELNVGRIGTTVNSLEQLAGLWRRARAYKKSNAVRQQKANMYEQMNDYVAWFEIVILEGECEQAEGIIKKILENKTVNSGYYYMQLGNCFYDLSQKAPKQNCKRPHEKGQRWRLQEKAIRVFDTAYKYTHSKNDFAANAQKWKTFIHAEQKAIQRRCQPHITRSNVSGK
ncbi:MAG: hypothetical protein COA43_09940 [Robiginitomaculum sp.]|nr:MAG: hypothetical protein COA43_09940 [Robiginitomaculum sp.]